MWVEQAWLHPERYTDVPKISKHGPWPSFSEKLVTFSPSRAHMSNAWSVSMQAPTTAAVQHWSYYTWSRQPFHSSSGSTDDVSWAARVDEFAFLFFPIQIYGCSLTVDERRLVVEAEAVHEGRRQLCRAGGTTVALQKAWYVPAGAKVMLAFRFVHLNVWGLQSTIYGAVRSTSKFIFLLSP
jgi:hypothetical protein